MASLLFGNNHRLKLVDDEDGGGPTESSFRTDWSSIVKPNRRPTETKLSKEDSMGSFDTDSLFSSAEGSGEPDSLAPQASFLQGGGTGTGGSRRALHLPPSYSNGRATPDTTMALAPSNPARRSKSSVVDSSLDSMLPNLPSTNKRQTGSTTTTTNSSSSRQVQNRQHNSFGSSFFHHPPDGEKGGEEWTSHTLKSETSLSFFDPNASRESFFLDDHTAEEQDEIDDSGRHTTRPLFNGYPSSRSIPLEGSFSAFSLEPDDEDEADELISPGTPATGTSSKPKLGLVRNDMPNVRWRTADFGVEDFQVTPTSRSDRSRSRRSLPSSIFKSASMVEYDTTSPPLDRSLRANRRTTLKASSCLNDLAKSPRLSTTAIDLTKAHDVAREKSKNLNSHRSSIRTKSMQRSTNRSKISKDRETIEGRLKTVLGGGDHDDETGLPPLPTPEGSHRSRRSSNSDSTKKQESSRRSSQRERSSSSDLDFDDVDFPGPMPKSFKARLSGSHEHGTSSTDCPTSSELSRKSQFPESESSRRTRTLDKKVTKENRDKNALPIESIRVNARPSLTKSSSSESNKSRRNLKDYTNTPTKTSTVEDDGKNSSRRTRTSSPRKSRVISETQSDQSKVQARGEGTLQDKFPMIRQMSKKGLDIDVISASEAIAQGQSESIWEKIEKEKERKQKIRDHIQVIQNDNSHLVSPSASRNKASFADFENCIKPMTTNFTTSATQDSFSVNFNTTFFDTTPMKQVGTGTAPREVGKVEPRIIRPGLGPTIPSRLKEAPVENKDESLDLSGHTNYTRSANWNWEEDLWDESKARLCPPTTIQEGDENADDTFGSPIVQTRKSSDANSAKSLDFLSPIVHKKKFASASPSSTQPKLNDFFQTTNKSGSPHRMETLKTDRSVSSAPSVDPFPTKELHRTTSMGRPPRPLVPERQLRRSDPSPRAVAETTTPTTRRQQGTMANETPSPKAVTDVFDQDDSKQKTTSATSKGVVRRSSGSTRRDTHEQRKGTVRDAMFNFLNEGD